MGAIRMSGARRRFRFIKEIAEGGFGKVYLAEQLSADGFSRIVALKLLHAKWSSLSDKQQQKFRAQALANRSKYNADLKAYRDTPERGG